MKENQEGELCWVHNSDSPLVIGESSRIAQVEPFKKKISLKKKIKGGRIPLNWLIRSTLPHSV